MKKTEKLDLAFFSELDIRFKSIPSSVISSSTCVPSEKTLYLFLMCEH